MSYLFFKKKNKAVVILSILKGGWGIFFFWSFSYFSLLSTYLLISNTSNYVAIYWTGWWNSSVFFNLLLFFFFFFFISFYSTHCTLDKKSFSFVDSVLAVLTVWCFLNPGVHWASSSAPCLLPPTSLLSLSVTTTASTITMHCCPSTQWDYWQILRAWAWIKALQIKRIATATIMTTANTHLVITTSPAQFNLIRK